MKKSSITSGPGLSVRWAQLDVEELTKPFSLAKCKASAVECVRQVPSEPFFTPKTLLFKSNSRSLTVHCLLSENPKN